MSDTQHTPTPRLSEHDLDEMAQSGSVRQVNAVIEITHLKAEKADLLAACEDFRDKMRRAYGFGHSNLDANAMECPNLIFAYDLARAAIAKATGEKK